MGNKNSMDSFLKSVFIFMLFIGLSIGITIGVQTITSRQMATAQQAAALNALFGNHK